MIDNKLNRNAHLEYAKTKAITSLGGLSPLSGSMWAARIITGAFKATLSPALDVEVHLLPLRQNLDKLTQESAMRIAESPSYSTLISTRSKCKNGRKTPLERLVMRYEQRTGLKIADLEKKTPYTTAPWWVSPHTTIHPNRDKAVKHQNKTMTKLNALHQILFYTDGSGKDWHSSGHPFYEPHFSSLSWSIPPLYCLRCGVSRDSSYPFDGKRPPLAKNPDCYPHGQAAIRAIQGPGRQSGQSILINIIEAIDALRTAKRATGWRNKRKRNGKMEETDTGPKAAQMHVSHLRSARKQANAKHTRDAWEEDWTTETRGHNLRALTPLPSCQTLQMHSKIRKGYSTITT